MKNLKTYESRKITFSISLALILLGVIMFIIAGFTTGSGFNLGIEFAGGVKITVVVTDVKDGTTFKDITDPVSKHLTDVFKLNVNQPQKVDTDVKTTMSYELTYSYQINGKDLKQDEYEVMELVKTLLEDGKDKLTADQQKTLKDYGIKVDEAIIINTLIPQGTAVISDEVKISPTVSNELFKNAILALVIALVAIMLYVIIRFRKLGGFSAGFAAIIALVHDVLIMLTFVTIAGLFGLQVNGTFVAAVVTIVAYSINNTIVIFDRIRENSAKNKTYTRIDLVNISVVEVMSRTIFTSLTTLLAVAILTLFGVPAIAEFTLPIIVGLIAGTYSSVFISGPLWAMFKPKAKKETITAKK